MLQQVRSLIRDYAVIDLGSNSFYLMIVRAQSGKTRIIGRVKQRVRLAAGLDANNQLDQASIERGLHCLRAFAARLQEQQLSAVSIVATASLRLANNAQTFVDQAEAILGYPVEVISGEQEAQLIYQGAVQSTQSTDTHANHLVIDIGGASTEVIVGDQQQSLHLHSFTMGCVTYMQRYFPAGQLSQQHFEQAIAAAKQQLAGQFEPFIQHGWQYCRGASGTPKAVCEILRAQGQKESIQLSHLLQLRAQCIHSNNLRQLDIAGLEYRRKGVFPAGVAILIALFECLKITEMRIASGALREGVLANLLRSASTR